MELRIYDEKYKDKWNKYVSENPFGNILQSWEWGDVKKDKNWDVLRFGAVYKRQVVGLAQILVRSLPLHFKILYSPYGPVLDWEMPYARDFLKLIIDYLKKEADHRYLFWKIEPPLTFSDAKTWKTIETLKSLGFEAQKKSIQPQNTIIVDLQKSEKDLLESFEKDTRYSIRRAEREEVEIREFNNSLNLQPLQEFYDLYKLTSERAHFPSRSWHQFERIWEEMTPDKVRVFQAWFKDELLAASLVFTYGKKAYLIYAGSSREKEYNKKFATYLIQYEIMRSLQKESIKSYDLWGVVPENLLKHPWAGISLFKRGFQGTEKEYIGAWDLPLSPFYKGYKMLGNLRSTFSVSA